MDLKRKNDGFKSERLISFKKLRISPVAEDVYLTDIGFFPNTNGHFVERNKGTNENILIYCASGEGIIEIKEKIRMAENELFIIPKNAVHKYYSSRENPWSIYWVHYNENRECSIEVGKKIAVKEKNLQILMKVLFSQIISILEQNISEKSIIYSNHTLKFLLESISYIPQLYVEYLNVNYSSTTNIAKLINYIDENIDKKISLDEMCTLISYSKSNLNKVFNEEYQMSPLEFVNDKKMRYAETLLRMTSLSIAEISERIGIPDSLYFSKCFKKKYEFSPSLYRLHLKEQSNSNLIK